MKYICCWSGGKDSTASIILAHLYNEPLDEIIMAEVMYDRKRNISGENPEHMEWVNNVAKPMFESWGYKVTIVRAERDYLESFYRIIERPRKHLEHKGKHSGFPISGLCSVKRDCKVSPINKYLKSLETEDKFIQYVGIAFDEKKRLDSLHKRKDISLLEKYEYTEAMCMELCKKYDLLSPTYKYTKRNGCWFCPNAKLVEHKLIYQSMPDIWEEFVKLEDVENLAFDKFNSYTQVRLKEIDKKIKENDDEQNTRTDTNIE